MTSEAEQPTLRRSETAAVELQAGQTVGRYQLRDVLGRGGMGEVWRAWDAELQRSVAIKFLLGQAIEDEKRFLQEAKTVAGLGHPQIAPVYEVGVHAGRSYIVLQYIEGVTLDRTPAALPERLRAVRDAARVLDFAHRRGIIHRDVKPSNLMAADGRVYVMDFGLARAVDVRNSVSRSGSVVGTPSYMSPEQARGEGDLDARTDVYSLGATLYDLLTGHPPFDGKDLFALMEKVARHDPPAPRSRQAKIPADVETIVQKAMAKERDRRYATALELAEDIDRYLTGQPILARPASVGYRLWKRVRRNPMAWAAGTAAVLLAMVAGGAVAAGAAGRAADRRAAELTLRSQDLVARGKTFLLRKTAVPAQWEALFDEALDVARGAVENYPHMGRPYLALGEVHEARNLWSEAVDAYTKAVEREPALAEAYYRRCVCLLEVFHEERTRPVVDKGDPDEREERKQRAEPYKRQAIEDLATYARLRGDRVPPYERRYVDAAVAYAEYRHGEAEKICDELLAQVGTDERVWLLKARAQHARKKPAEALKTIETLLADVMPQFARAHHFRAWFKQRAEDWTGADEAYTTALQLDPRFNWTWAGRARVRRALQRWADAEADYTAAIGRGVPDPVFRMERGLVREKLGRREDALADLEKGLAAAAPSTPGRQEAEQALARLRAR